MEVRDYKHFTSLKLMCKSEIPSKDIDESGRYVFMSNKELIKLWKDTSIFDRVLCKIWAVKF
jgi:hypothetical protein